MKALRSPSARHVPVKGAPSAVSGISAVAPASQHASVSVVALPPRRGDLTSHWPSTLASARPSAFTLRRSLPMPALKVIEAQYLIETTRNCAAS